MTWLVHLNCLCFIETKDQPAPKEECPKHGKQDVIGYGLKD